MNLKNKVAIVTGGAVRVGRAIVLALAEQGCHIVLHYGRSGEEALETAAEAKSLGVRVQSISADLTNADAPAQIMQAATDTFGQVDILINSAAIFPDEDRFPTTGAALFDQLMAVNLRAPFFLSQVFAAHVGKDRQAKIINITDARIYRSQPDHFVYRLTKLSLRAMTEMAALEVAPNITVNAVALGAILPPPGKDRAYLDAIANEHVPIQQSGSVNVVTDTIVHLLTQDFINGTVVKLDGGEHL